MKIITLSIVVKERSNALMFFIFEHGAEYSDNVVLNLALVSISLIHYLRI